jgi:hypothetical protein
VLLPAEVVDLLAQRREALREEADRIRTALRANQERDDTDGVFVIEDE